jgi:hypothetical protein
MNGANVIADDAAALILFRQWREALDLANACDKEDEDKHDDLCDQAWAIERQIFDIPMPSAIGMAVKACILIYNEKSGPEHPYDSDGHLRLDQHALRGLAADVARLLPEAKPFVAWILNAPLMLRPTPAA